MAKQGERSKLSENPKLPEKIVSSRQSTPPDEALNCPRPRVVIFPDTVVGQFIIFRTIVDGGVEKLDSKPYPAKGKVAIPANTFTKLEVAPVAIAHPELLDKLPADGIDSISMRYSSMEEGEDSVLDRALAHIGHIKSLKKIYFSRSDVSDVGLSKLDGLSDLRLLEAGMTAIHGEFLKSLTGLKKLRNLRLGGNEIIEKNLACLKEFPVLKQLSLARCRLTLQGLSHVSHCPLIYELDISQNPRIGDNEMTYLLPLKKLIVLDLEGTNVSLSGLATLKALPLIQLSLPRSKYSEDDMKRLREYFPHAKLELAKHDMKTKAAETEDMNIILGPVTRD